MILKIKKRIEAELNRYLIRAERIYHIRHISPLLFKQIRNFILSKGKRIRPILFCIGYLGFAKKQPTGLYQSAISFELLHDFMLIHDDIIDKSPLRRGKPSMHARLNKYLNNFKTAKFNGEDLSIVIGDIIYAMSLNAFLDIKEDARRKEMALKKFIEAALYTGAGEFVELILGLKALESLNKEDVYKVYDLKTANYTFVYPLIIGAMLAGADKKQVASLSSYGKYLGRAFQIKDDIIGLFSEEIKIGKSNLTDLQEAKKTILIWHAFRKSSKAHRSLIKKILSKEYITRNDLLRMRKIIIESGAMECAKKEISEMLDKSDKLLKKCSMCYAYKKILQNFSQKIISL